jgi:hypothetical protein
MLVSALLMQVGLFVVNPAELPAEWGIDASADSLPRWAVNYYT